MPLDENRLVDLMVELRKTLMRKNALYRDAVFSFGEYGILVRAWDKIVRLRTLLEALEASDDPAEVPVPRDEIEKSIDDAWKDLAGYAVLGLYYRRHVRKQEGVATP